MINNYNEFFIKYGNKAEIDVYEKKLKHKNLPICFNIVANSIYLKYYPYNLKQLLNNKIENIKITDDIKFNIIFSLLDVIDFLHSNKIIHNDISLKNILIDINKETNVIEPILIDFNNSSIDFTYKKFGTPRYIHPLLLLNTNINISAKIIDVWSLTVVIYYILFNKYPFDGKSREFIYRKIKLKQFNKKIPNKYKKFFTQAFNYSSNDNISIDFLKKQLILLYS